MRANPPQGFVDLTFDEWLLWGPILLIPAAVIVVMIVDGIKDSGRGPDPPDSPVPTCPDCGHPTYYHGVQTCWGKVDGSVGFAGEDEQRCPCTRKYLKRLEG